MIIVLRCGYESRHKTKFNIIRKTGVPNYILLLVKTTAYFEFYGKTEITDPNMAILFDRNTYMNYGNIQDLFNNDWIHFDFVNEPSLFDHLNIPFNQPIYLPQINQLSNYVRLLVQEEYMDTLHKKQIQDALMRLLLYSFDAQIAMLPSYINNHRHFSIMNQLRMNIHNTPHKKWTVTIMADYVHMSSSYFQHIYKEIFHISCIQEVIQARIRRAKLYLTTTDMPIKELSDFCGYENEMHFIRQFKKNEGHTPTQYRQLYKINENAE